MKGARRGVIAGIVSALAATGGGVGPARQQKPGPAPVQPTRLEVSLTEAVRRALDVQPEMIQARGAVRTAGASGLTAWGAFLPTVTTNASASRSNQDRFDPASTQRLPPGYSYSGGLTASLDLFDGFRRLADGRAASAGEDAAGAGLVNQRYQTTLATQQAFFTALANEELARVGEAQLQRAKEELQIAVNKFQAGAATRSDTLTATVDLGNAQLSLLQARANLATAHANLGRQIGVDQPVRAVPDTTFPSVPDTAALRTEALESSPQGRQAEAMARAAGAQVGVARSAYWPTFSVSYANGYTGLDSLGRLGVVPWSTTQSYLNNWALRFSLSWTLFNGFSREANQVSASVQRDVAQTQAADARRQVNAQLTQQL